MKKSLDSNVIYSDNFYKLTDCAKLCYINLLFLTDPHGFTCEIDFSKDEFFDDYITPCEVKELIDNDLIIFFKSNVICIKDYFVMNKFDKNLHSYHLEELMMAFINDDGRYCIKNEYLNNVEDLEDIDEFELLELLRIETKEELIDDYEQLA